MSTMFRDVGILLSVVVVTAVWGNWPAHREAVAAAAGVPLPRARVAAEFDDIQKNILAGRDRFTLSVFGETTRVTVLAKAGTHASWRTKGSTLFRDVKVHQEGPWGAETVTYTLESADGTDNILRVQISPEPSRPDGEEDFLVNYPEDGSWLYDMKRRR